MAYIGLREDEDLFGGYQTNDEPRWTSPVEPEKSPIPTPTNAGPIPTNTNGSQVGGGIPWAPGASKPSSAPAGYQWDDNLAMFQPTSGGGGNDLRKQLEDYFSGRGVTPYATSIDYWLGKKGELDARGQQIGNPNYFWDRVAAADEFGGGYGGGGGNYNGGSIFDDPATGPFMQLLTSRINALNQPYRNPQLDQLNGYLQQYFQRLQGPAYTPEQMDLLQTQSLDPLSRERDSARQRVIENASRRGLDPKSGIVQKQISDLENQFEQIRTKTQAGFASKAVDLDRINAQQAASVGQLLANIEQTAFNQNEQRANQALELAQIVPNLARQRMLDANSIMSQTSLNPTSLLGLQMNQESMDAQRNQQFWLSIASLIPQLLPLLGVGRG